jgi:hypothetical protein
MWPSTGGDFSWGGEALAPTPYESPRSLDDYTKLPASAARGSSDRTFFEKSCAARLKRCLCPYNPRKADEPV